MAKLFRNYNTLVEYEADTNKPVNTVCFIKDAKVIYVDGIQYSYKQLDYLPPAINEAEALEYMGKIIKNAQEVGFIDINKPDINKPKCVIYYRIAWDSTSAPPDHIFMNTINVNGKLYDYEDSVNIDNKRYFKVTVDGNIIESINPADEYANGFKNVIFENVVPSEKCNSLFDCHYYLESVDFGNKWDTSNVTNMCNMFGECYNLKTIKPPISEWNISNVTRMDDMFNMCQNVSDEVFPKCTPSYNITNLSRMFAGTNVSEPDFSWWDSGENGFMVNYLDEMFASCKNLKTVNFNSIIMPYIESTSYMFYGCSNLIWIDFGKIDLSNVDISNMNNMFKGCNNLKYIMISDELTNNYKTRDKIVEQLANDGINGVEITFES